ncbi:MULTISPECIES: hypothetical protein [Aeribacillus]|jgi:hypothetical protein|uniref:Uncharacterized protein n=1 Tax=Aeribacillus composti TaxID=1868734 RepID=A0ABY9WBS6_9BACI|nr:MULTISPECIES: hypothetical protein [Aeribacillus]MED0704341.1 hypothetical protein [Aeribacillus composti]MED1442967.1 hypothetical protein [Aeribacillus composti]WNF31517.1 hypothetical protein RI196_09325 [Aeribacillus composti]
MGEFLFTLGYGGSLIILGLITHAFIRNMDHSTVPKRSENTD